MRAAIDALLDAGFVCEDIEILHGEEGLARLDPTGEAHGFFERFQRTLIRTAAPNEEYAHLIRHVDDVRAGRYVIMVLASRREQRMTAADILSEHGAEFIGFYGRWAWEGRPSDVPARAVEGEPGGRVAATQPDRIPSLFADAWNARDANALAALFDEDAEFVNVTGLWWHDRASIREAHAYGFERIFSESTLSVQDTKVRTLSDDVAVVHARMTLSGQTPIADIVQPGSRTNVFSFVVHRIDGGWQCASAHNTDVVPNMETNVIGEDGRLQAANYRTRKVSKT
jgi:uncharacterized protein (TIGR02246 family)